MFKHYQMTFLYVTSSSFFNESSQANSFFNLMLQELVLGYLVCKLTLVFFK